MDRFVNDPLCGFPLTVQGYIDLGALLHAVNSDEWYRRLPKKLPVYLISGESDPVGGMGKGVRKIEKKLRETGHDVTMTLYPRVRHALVTEVRRRPRFRGRLRVWPRTCRKRIEENPPAAPEAKRAAKKRTRTDFCLRPFAVRPWLRYG